MGLGRSGVEYPTEAQAGYAEPVARESALAGVTARTLEQVRWLHGIADTLENIADRTLGCEPQGVDQAREATEPPYELGRITQSQDYLDGALQRLQRVTERLTRL